MAKAKVLDNKIVITSEVLTEANIEKVKILAPSILKLIDENDMNARVLYEVDSNPFNTFNANGALFYEGRTTTNLDEEIMLLDTEERRAKINTLVTSVLTKINRIETIVTEYLDNAEDFSEDIEFLD